MIAILLFLNLIITIGSFFLFGVLQTPTIAITFVVSLCSFFVLWCLFSILESSAQFMKDEKYRESFRGDRMQNGP